MSETDYKQKELDELKEHFEFEQLRDSFSEVVDNGSLADKKRFFHDVVVKKYQKDYNKTNLAEEIKNWVMTDATGIFTIDHVQRSLNLSNEDRKYVSKVLSRIAEVCPTKRRPGEYRMSNSDMNKVEWLNVSSKPIKIKLPLDIHKHAEVYPSNIILIAGVYNAGKSGFCLSSALLNMARYQIDYYTCEMDKHEYAKRVEIMNLSNGEKQEFYERVNVWERSYDFDDVINPNGFSIIDYMSAPAGAAYEIKDQMERLHNKLLEGKGICIVAQHKKHSSDHAYGGERAYDRPRLVIAIESGTAKLIKVKNWATEDNPNGKFINYKLHQGHRFECEGVWRTEDADETAKGR